MADDVITLWRYRDLPEALIVQSKLSSEGIASFLADDELVRLNWYLSNAVGGVRLRVRQSDAEPALEILRQQIPQEFTADEVGEEYQQPACPDCGSLDVSFEAVNRPAALVALWFSVPLPLPANLWRCEHCGHEWKGEYV